MIFVSDVGEVTAHGAVAASVRPATETGSVIAASRAMGTVRLMLMSHPNPDRSRSPSTGTGTFDKLRRRGINRERSIGRSVLRCVKVVVVADDLPR